MSNHLHPVVGTPRANVVLGTKWLRGVYAMGDFTKPRTDPFRPVSDRFRYAYQAPGISAPLE